MLYCPVCGQRLERVTNTRYYCHTCRQNRTVDEAQSTGIERDYYELREYEDDNAETREIYCPTLKQRVPARFDGSVTWCSGCESAAIYPEAHQPVTPATPQPGPILTCPLCWELLIPGEMDSDQRFVWQCPKGHYAQPATAADMMLMRMAREKTPQEFEDWIKGDGSLFDDLDE